MKPRLVIILGPTGVGKSEVTMDVALEIGGEIINADSQQVYRLMDIGTGKPGPDQTRKVPHHLIDVIEPDGEFNAALFRQLAVECAQQIWSRGKRVIVCGGTGLYIKALTQGLFVGPAGDPELRERLQAEAGERGLAVLHDRLRDVDPEAAASIHPNDGHRIIRALEVFELSGKRLTRWQGEHGFGEKQFESLKIGLNRERKELYDLINGRCAEMVERGLVEEVKRLLEKGYSPDLKSLQSIGYRHMALYLRGAVSLEEALSLMQRDTRHLARRQLTWFRGDKEIQWFHPEKERGKILATVRAFLA